MSEEGWLLSYADLITNLLIFFAMMLAAAEVNTSKMQQIAESLSGKEQPASLASIQAEIDRKIEEEGLQELVRTDLTDQGLKLSLASGLVFDPGSADIRLEQEDVLDRMLQTLVPYATRYQFAVEGHTDSTPIGNSIYPSNWELSTSRANAVRSRLELVGVDRTHVRVEGYADTVPLPEESLLGLGPEDRLARHRRVIVRIY
ncbi:MAG: flagellar motor protein MotB [Myxococcota bacterium]|jgi:chemotaxis protein MotB